MKFREQLAGASERIRKVADSRGAEIIRSQEISRKDRELLVSHHFLQEITRGWYLLKRADVPLGDSGPWYSHFWDFLRCYLSERFGKAYCLSAESSLGLHTGNTLIPDRVTVMTKRGAGNPLLLPFDTSILAYAARLPEEREEIQGLQVMPLPLALARLPPSYYQEKPEEVELGLQMIPSSAGLSRILLQDGLMRAASRLIGAYLATGNQQMADQIQEELSRGGMRLPPTENPFPYTSSARSAILRSPYAARIETSWAKLRNQVIRIFPPAPGLPKDTQLYLQNIRELYQLDAYHSLSIEGYRISPELIERVRNHQWNPDHYIQDQQAHQALAARGYYEAFCEVEKSIAAVLKEPLMNSLGSDRASSSPTTPGVCEAHTWASRAEQTHGVVGEEGVRDGSRRVNQRFLQGRKIIIQDLQEWYRALWTPQVQTGILQAHDVVGYRRGPVFIRGSRHTPPPREALIDAMEALFNCLEKEPHPAVRAVLGHYFFVFIHPYPDGNGRIGRFLMNAMLASGGYPWTVIRFEHRNEYFSALESTHLEGNVGNLAELICREMA